jgi:hypothetical protein
MEGARTRLRFLVGSGHFWKFLGHQIPRGRTESLAPPSPPMSLVYKEEGTTMGPLGPPKSGGASWDMLLAKGHFDILFF